MTGPKPRVLVVEDQEDQRLLWRTILEDAGIEVVTVESGERALELLEQDRPDAIMLDGYLPGLSGWEVLQRIRAMPDLASIPVVMMTADATRDHEAQGYGAGASKYLTKPIRVDGLVNAMREVLEDGHGSV